MFAKRICTLLICFALLFSVFGCSKKTYSETPGNVTGTTSRNEETVDLNAINDRFSGNNSDAQASSEGLEYVEVDRVIGDGPNAYRLVGIGSCTDTDIVISNLYNDLEVRWIGPSAFQNNTSIENVTSYVGQLESNAFAGCSSLKTITFLIPTVTRFSSLLWIIVCLHMILKILPPGQLTDLTPWSFVNRTIFPQSITESVFLPNN